MTPQVSVDPPRNGSERAAGGRDTGLRDGLPFCLVVFAIARLATSITLALGVGTHAPDPSALAAGSPPQPFTLPATPGIHNAINGLQRWDAAWYLWIATDGYGGPSDDRPAFFPGYPIAIDATGVLTAGNELAAATLVSNLCYLVSLVVLYGLTAAELGPHHSRRAVALFAALPGSLFFLAPYSESLFLLLALLAFWWTRRGRPGKVVAVGLAAGLVRVMSLALVPGLAWSWWIQRRERSLRSILAVVSPAIGVCVYLLWWAVRSDALTPFRAQSFWGRTLTAPPATIIRGVQFAVEAIIRGTRIDLVIDAVSTIAIIATAILMIRRVSAPYVAYVWSTLLVPLTFPWPSRPFLSFVRLTCVLFPLAWTWVLIVRSRIGLGIMIGALATCQLALLLVFANWGWFF
jgi:hypothetical protein